MGTGYVITPHTDVGTPPPARTTGASTTSTTFSGLVTGHHYWFTVQATNARGPGLPAATKTVTVT